MTSEMKFRDELLARLLAVEVQFGRPLSSHDELKTIVGFVDRVAVEACEQWGHDETEFYLSAPGMMTLARPTMEHRHWKCRRCGREIRKEQQGAR